MCFVQTIRRRVRSEDCARSTTSWKSKHCNKTASEKQSLSSDIPCIAFDPGKEQGESHEAHLLRFEDMLSDPRTTAPGAVSPRLACGGTYGGGGVSIQCIHQHG